MPQPLSRVQFRNWRSLCDVTIDFDTPITVFIGANASGKTNIIDGLRFYRDSLRDGLLRVVNGLNYTRIQTDAAHNTSDVEVAFSFNLQLPNVSDSITERMILQFDKRTVPFRQRSIWYKGEATILDMPMRELPPRDENRATTGWSSEEVKLQEARARPLIADVYRHVERRWQMLGDSFVLPTRLSQHDGGDLYLIEPDARNMLTILNFMQQAMPELFNQLQEDFRWLMDHVTAVGVRSSDLRELELLITEKYGGHAPTISTGTLRVLAVLTAIYALDMPQATTRPGDETVSSAKDPGLVVIEEPDSALNPGLLARFVGQLRYYTSGEHPRQIILTTHNPAFIDYFEADEIRVVRRDEAGDTSVERIPDDVRDLWLKSGEYGVAQAWLSNAFGGVPE